MSKVVLVMSDPMFCCNCPLARYKSKTGEYFCGIPNITDRDYCFKKVDMGLNDKPTWCPLKPLPEENENEYVLEWSRGYQGGWNDCIKAITGDKND